MTIPRADIWNSAGDTLDLEAKMFITAYDAYSNENLHIFGMYQGWNHYFTFYEGKWDPPRIRLENPTSDLEVMDSTQVENLIPVGQWFQLNFLLMNGKSSVYLNGEKIAEVAVLPEFEGSGSDIDIRLGGFMGYIDEVRISNVDRCGTSPL